MRIGVIATLAVCACGRVNFEPRGDGTGDADAGVAVDAPGSQPSDASSGTCTTPAIASCPDQTMMASFGIVTSQSTQITTPHDLASTLCSAGGNTPEAIFVVTPTNRANFQFQAVTSNPFSTIYVLDGCCGGAELQCGMVTGPRFLQRDAGQTFTVVVEGTLGSTVELMVAGLLGVD